MLELPAWRVWQPGKQQDNDKGQQCNPNGNLTPTVRACSDGGQQDDAKGPEGLIEQKDTLTVFACRDVRYCGIEKGTWL